MHLPLCPKLSVSKTQGELRMFVTHLTFSMCLVANILFLFRSVSDKVCSVVPSSGKRSLSVWSPFSLRMFLFVLVNHTDNEFEFFPRDHETFKRVSFIITDYWVSDSVSACLVFMLGLFFVFFS